MAPAETTKTKIETEKPKKKDEGPPDLSKHADIIDPSTFEQILEMDDDSEREFSKGIVYGFFDQAETTFDKMEKALSSEDFDELSQLGHFLKGSSATLGLTKIKDACEKIQHCKEDVPTKKEDAEKKKTVMAGINQTLKEVQEDYNEVSKLLKRFYGEKVDSESS